jgi:hypothetical protein
MALPAHEVLAVHVRLKSISIEGHFTLEAETVSSAYLPSHFSGVSEICDTPLPAHALQAVEVTLKWVTNERHFTVEAEKVFVYISPLIAVG